MALIGVGNMFAAFEYAEKGVVLFSGLSTELIAEAVGIVEAVGRSSSVRAERVFCISRRRYGPRYDETESRLGGWLLGVGLE